MQGVRDLLNIARTFNWTDTPGSNAGLIFRAQRFALRTQMTFVVNHSLYLVLRIVTKSKNKLFFNSWIPFDDEGMVSYILILVIQVSLTIVGYNFIIILIYVPCIFYYFVK